jgi:DNA polymerase III subunit epsilon
MKISKRYQQTLYSIMPDAESWADLPLLGFDLETTGVDPYTCRMVDMAIVLDKNDGNDPITWQWLINPGCEIPLECTAVHGINTEHVIEHGISPVTAIEELNSTISKIMTDLGDMPPVCVYNAAYDMPILLRESWGALGYWNILDAMILDKYADKFRPGKRTLTSVNAAYGLGVRNAHRAAGDCISAIRVTRAIGRKYPQIGYAPVGSLQDLQRSAYRDQMGQFREYKRKYDDPYFDLSLQWPYSEERIDECLAILES